MVCGTVGFLSSYIFVKHIYSLIKVDWLFMATIIKKNLRAKKGT